MRFESPNPNDDLNAALAAMATPNWLIHGAKTGWRLSFSAGLEQGYRAAHALTVLSIQRFSALLSVVLYLGYFGLQIGVLGRELTAKLWLPVIAVSVPANLIYYALLRHPWGRARSFSLSAGVTTLNAAMLSLTSVFWLDGSYGPLPAEAPVIQQIYNTLLMGLPFALAWPVAALSILLYAWMHAQAEVPLADLSARVFLLSAAAIVGLLAAYSQERNQRMTWLRGARLQQLADHDGLTGLLTHRCFYERAEGSFLLARAQVKTLAVILLDLDHFKRYNDRHGHLAGDECLRRLAEVLRQQLPVAAGFIGRLGGEEFAIALPNQTLAEAGRIAEHLRQRLASEEMMPGVFVTSSFGVAACAPGVRCHKLHQLVGEADRQLYRAKAAGRNRVCHSQDDWTTLPH
jgi:diguanylate cyclase (GGDEF)-like protein